MKVGIVLAGGMAKGAYQVGALKAINEYFSPDEISAMSCSSIGVLNGYGYVTGKIDAVEDMWRNVCGDANRLYITSILKGDYVRRSIRREYSPKDVIAGDFYASLLNLSKRTIDYTNLTKVDKRAIPYYLRASVAMPVYNKWVTINEEYFYDGAMVDNIPVFPLMDADLDYIICIYFDEVSYIFEDKDFDKKILKVMFKANHLVSDSLIFNRESIDKMIDVGYTKTKKILDHAFAKGTDDLDHIMATIQHINEQRGEPKLRMTGDFMVTNMNKVVQKLIARKII